MAFEKNEQPQWRRDIANELVQLICNEAKVDITASDYLIDEVAARLGVYPDKELLGGCLAEEE